MATRAVGGSTGTQSQLTTDSKPVFLLISK